MADRELSMLAGSQLAPKPEFHLLFPRGSEMAELLVEHAGLDVFVVLVLVASIFANIAGDLVIEDLADGNAGINANRLDGKHFQRPVAAKANIAKACRNVDKQAKPANARPAFDHGHKVVRFCPLHCASQVKALRTEDEPFGRYDKAARAVGLRHVEHHFFVGEKFVMQREVVAVGVESRGIEGIDMDVGAQIATNFIAGENHWQNFLSRSKLREQTFYQRRTKRRTRTDRQSRGES